MPTQDVAELFTPFFAGLTDPRLERTQRHTLLDIIILAVCATLGNANGWADIERFSKAKLDFFRTFLDLPNGIPSHDTFGRVFARLDPAQLMASHPTVARRRSALPWLVRWSPSTARRYGVRSTRRLARRIPLHLVARLGLRRSADAGPSGGRYQIERNHGDSPATRIARPQGLYRHHRRHGLPERDCLQPSAWPRRGLCVGRQGQPAELTSSGAGGLSGLRRRTASPTPR